MIIECRSCRARFRLDESKIRGKGARVKCRKCGDMILVLRDDESGAVSQEPGREGSLDLSSALRETSREDSGTTPEHPSPNNLIPFPGPARAPEPPPPAERDEVDRAFDELLGETAPPDAPAPEISAPGEVSEPDAGAELPEESSPAPEEPSAGPPIASEASDVEPELPEEPFLKAEEPPAPPAAEALDSATGAEAVPEFAPDEKLELAPLLPEAPAVEEPSAPGTPDPGFLVSSSETLDFLQHGGTASEGASSADISRRIAAEPIELDIAPPAELEATAFPPAADFVAPPSDLPLEGNATPEPVEPTSEHPGYEDPERLEPISSRPIPTPYPETLPPPEPAPRAGGSRSLAAGVALVAVLILAAGYFGFTATGKQALQGLVPRLAALVGGKGSATPASRYDVQNVIGYYESGASSPKLLVIRGQVVNRSKTGKSGIRVRAALLDSNGQVLGETVVYAGNVLSTATLKAGTRSALEKALANPLGERLSNMDVLPGKTVPFMVLFFDAPENIDSYRLEAGDNE